MELGFTSHGFQANDTYLSHEFQVKFRIAKDYTIADYLGMWISHTNLLESVP